jgi:hypothetical protein
MTSRQPYGEIGWERLSRLSDEEMKALMIDVVNHCYDFLTTLCGPFGDTIVEHLRFSLGGTTDGQDADAHDAVPPIGRWRRGSRTVNSVNRPSSLSTVIVPPCCWVTIS